MKSAKNGTISPSKSTKDGMDPLTIYNMLSFVRPLSKKVGLGNQLEAISPPQLTMGSTRCVVDKGGVLAHVALVSSLNPLDIDIYT
jgi:hypothetical protein